MNAEEAPPTEPTPFQQAIADVEDYRTKVLELAAEFWGDEPAPMKACCCDWDQWCGDHVCRVIAAAYYRKEVAYLQAEEAAKAATQVQSDGA